MRLPIVLLLSVLLIDIAVDFYIYRVCLARFKAKTAARIQLATAAALYVYLIVAVSMPRTDGGDNTLVAIMWMLFGYFTVYIPKYIFTLFDLLASVPRIFRRPRIKALTWVGVALAAVTFFALWWAALVNRFRTQVREVEIEVPGLPAAFDGYRIAQISDLHTGTYGTDTAFVAKVVDDVNALRPDVIFFTGDIVNRHTEELPPFVAPLSRLSAPGGVYSILGNHDYGDYSSWPSAKAKEDNMTLLYDLQRAMGWRLLRNEHTWLRAGGDSIALVGVENVGDPPFKCYGSLATAFPAGDSITSILLTHNPAHWVDSVAPAGLYPADLTLSGHTHAMQIEILGMSPAAFRYPTWGGLYKSDDGRRQLYVNIGLGTVGIPMRLGATPEITLITLRTPNNNN